MNFLKILIISIGISLFFWFIDPNKNLGWAEEPIAPHDSSSPQSTLQTDPGNEGSVSIEASVDRAQITTRDIVTYTITTHYPDGFRMLVWPQVGNKINDLRIVDLGTEEPTKEGDQWKARKWFKLRADMSGSYVLPPVEVEYETREGKRESQKTGEVFLEVLSQSPVATDSEKSKNDPNSVQPALIDIHEAQSLGVHPYWYYFGSVFGISGIIIVFGLLWSKRRKSPFEVPPRPPHEIAMESLSQLTLSPGASGEEVKRFHFLVSHVLRNYIEQRFQIPATDRTTEEISEIVMPISELNEANRNLLLEILKETDRVKFTDFHPEERQSMETHSKTASFILGTRKELRSSVEAEKSDNEFL